MGPLGLEGASQARVTNLQKTVNFRTAEWSWWYLVLVMTACRLDGEDGTLCSRTPGPPRRGSWGRAVVSLGLPESPAATQIINK